MTEPSTAPKLNPAALPLDVLARLLTRVGGTSLTAAMLQADVDAGAPTNPDGTLHLVHYAAWLLHDTGRRRDPLHDD